MFGKVVDMVEDRQDAFFIGDLTSVNDTIKPTTQTDAIDSNYVGSYYPWVKTIDINTNKLTAVPPSVLITCVYTRKLNDRLAGSNGLLGLIKQRWNRRSSFSIKQIDTR